MIYLELLIFLLTYEDQVQRTFYVYKVLVYYCMFGINNLDL